MKIKFEPRDIWVGLYWNKIGDYQLGCARHVTIRFWLCLIPCFPISWNWSYTVH